MAEFIQKTDTLNEGREKLNAAIQDAEDAKITAEDADRKATQALAKSESTQTQLDTIVIEGDSSVEAAQARVDEKGVAHATLKARIDNGFEKITAQLAETYDDVESRGINVKNYGVKGDGVTDDTLALKNIWENLQDGDSVFFPKGVYRVFHQGGIEDSYMILTEKNNIRIYGENGTLFHIEHDMTEHSLHLFRFYGCENITIENIEVNYQASGHPNYNIRGEQTRASIFAIHESGSKGSKNVTIKGCRLRINHPEGAYPGEPYIENGHQYEGSGKIIGLTFYGNHSTKVYCEGFNFIDNEFYDSQGRIVWLWYAKDVQIKGNRFYDCGGIRPPIRILTGCKNINVDGNYIRGIDGVHEPLITLSGQTITHENITITNNILETGDGAGILLRRTKNATVVGNIVKVKEGYTLVSDSSIYSGILIDGQTDDVSRVTKNIIVSNNTVIGKSNGIAMIQVAKISILGNRINDSLVNGIYAVINDCVIESNSVFDSGVNGIQVVRLQANGFDGNSTIRGNKIKGSLGRAINHASNPEKMIVEGNSIEENIAGIRTGNWWVVSNNIINHNKTWGISIDGLRCNISGNVLDSNNTDGDVENSIIKNGSGGIYCVISNNMFTGGTQKFIELTSTGNLIVGNYVGGMDRIEVVEGNQMYSNL